MKVYARIEIDDGVAETPMLSLCFLMEDGTQLYCEFIENLNHETLSEKASEVYLLSMTGMGVEPDHIVNTPDNTVFIGSTSGCMDAVALFFSKEADESMELVVDGMDQFYRIMRIIDRSARSKFNMARSIDAGQIAETLLGAQGSSKIVVPRILISGREVGVGRNAMSGARNVRRLYSSIRDFNIREFVLDQSISHLTSKLNDDLSKNPVTLFSFFENDAIKIGAMDDDVRAYLGDDRKKCSGSDYLGYLLTHIHGKRIVLDADCVQKGTGRIINKIFVDG